MRESVRNSKLEPSKFSELERPKMILGVGEVLDNVEVHGGLTFAGLRNKSALWYFGFDCGHASDLSPGLDAMTKLLYVDESVKWKECQKMFGDWKYRDINYVKAECQRLARQLKAMDNVKVPIFTLGAKTYD
jgi:hypothetical protein